MYPPTTFVLSLPHTRKSHLDWGQFKTVCLCVAHAALQAHLQEFLDCWDLDVEIAKIETLGYCDCWDMGIENVKNFLTVKTWDLKLLKLRLLIETLSKIEAFKTV
jgi:hypothetical protein